MFELKDHITSGLSLLRIRSQKDEFHGVLFLHGSPLYVNCCKLGAQGELNNILFDMVDHFPEYLRMQTGAQKR